MENDNLLQQKDIDFVTKAVAKLENIVTGGFEKVNSRLDIMYDSFVKKELLDDAFNRLEKAGDAREIRLQKEIDALKDTNKWLVRTVVGIIISAIVGSILII